MDNTHKSLTGLGGEHPSVIEAPAAVKLEYGKEQLRSIRIAMAIYSVVPIVLMVPILLAVFASGGISPFLAVGLLCLLTMFVGPLLIWAVFMNALHSVVMDKEGLSFSKQSGWHLLGRRTRSWSDLHSMQMVFAGARNPVRWRDSKSVVKWYQYSGGSMAIGPRLVFDFKSGGTAEISLNELSVSEAETLFRGLEQFADPAKFSADVLNLEKSVLLGQAPSYTEIWQNDLAIKYIATNYVPLRTNQILQNGRYRVSLELACGGMSAVYLCASDDNKKVVLKEAVMPATADNAQRQKAQELFAREARLLMQLDHRQIAKVYDNFSENDRDYLVLEHIAGQSLRQIVQKTGKIDESRALRWAQDLSSILVYLHSQQPPILHRDLSPDNVILGEDGRIVLVDFGAANEYLGNATGTFIGKQCYMSPEQLRGKATVQSDIYSLGATLYYLLTAKEPIPLAPADPQDVEPQISVGCSTLVTDCTRFDQALRPPTAAEVSNRISLALNAPTGGGKK